MALNASAGAAPELTQTFGFDRGAALTRSLLGYGMLAGPFYLTLGLIQAFVRDGFVFSRHPLSVLANGPGGWAQITNFALTGLMVIAAAVGFSRVLGSTSRATSRWLGTFGASMVAAAFFRADPMDGFPVGTPPGLPASMSGMGMAHLILGTLGFTALGVTCCVAARAMSRLGMRSAARLSFASGLVVFVAFYGGGAFSNQLGGTVGIWVAVVVGWAWLTAMSSRLYRMAPDPNRAPR